MATLHPHPTVAHPTGGLHFRLDRGLDSVTRQEGALPHLPDGRAMPAPDMRSLAALDALLAAASLDSLVEAAIRPRIDDPALLLPGRFSEALRQARESLARGLGTRSLEGSRRQRRLRRALAVLEEQEELMTLLWNYRHALHQG